MANWGASGIVVPTLGHVLTGSKTGLALDSAYTYNSAGDAVAVRFPSPVTSNLTDVYFFLTGVNGTPGNTTVELRNYSSATLPGSTLHASQTVSPGTSSSKWVKCTFGTPFQCVQGDTYFVVVGDAAGSASPFITVLQRGHLGSSTTLPFGYFDSVTTTGGFASGTTDNNYAAGMVLKFADGSVLGCPYTTNASYTSNTRERGIKLTGLTEKLTVNGVFFNASTLFSGLKIYSGTTAPGGTPDLTVTFGTGEAALGYAKFAPFTFLKNTVYRVVLTISSNHNGPNYFQVEDSATYAADLLAAGILGGAAYDTIDNGAGGWTDNADRYPRMALAIQDQVAIAAGGAVSISPMRGNF